jgi:hypothetical protein
VYPKTGDYERLIQSMNELLEKKPHVWEFMDGYELPGGIKEVFEE